MSIQVILYDSLFHHILFYRPDGLAVATTSADQTCKLWDVNDQNLVKSESISQYKFKLVFSLTRIQYQEVDGFGTVHSQTILP
jgi:WD40 repeat protein